MKSFDKQLLKDIKSRNIQEVQIIITKYEKYALIPYKNYLQRYDISDVESLTKKLKKLKVSVQMG